MPLVSGSRLLVSLLPLEYTDNGFFWEMTSRCLRILQHVAPVLQVQEQIVEVVWLFVFVVEQNVDVQTRLWR